MIEEKTKPQASTALFPSVVSPSTAFSPRRSPVEQFLSQDFWW